MILSPYFLDYKGINALRAQAGYGFMKMNVSRVQTTKFGPSLQVSLTLLLAEPIAGLPGGIEHLQTVLKPCDLTFVHPCTAAIRGQICLKPPVRARIACNLIG